MTLKLNEREGYLLMHAVDEAARREGAPSSGISDRGRELWALLDKVSAAGACFVFPKPANA